MTCPECGEPFCLSWSAELCYREERRERSAAATRADVGDGPADADLGRGAE